MDSSLDIVNKAIEELQNKKKINPLLANVKSIQFGVLSPDEIKRMSLCEIKSSRVMPPFDKTVYDERMGPLTSNITCKTCMEDLRICPGHFGFIELNEPIINPLFLKYVVLILNCFCSKCSKLRMSKKDIELEMNISKHNTFIKFADKINLIVKKLAGVEFCRECSIVHPIVREINGSIYKSYDGKEKCKMSAREIQKIFINISDEDLNMLGFNALSRVFYNKNENEVIKTFRPEWLIMTFFPIMPPMSRPPAIDGESRCDDDLTTAYSDIIKFNDKLKNCANESLKEDIFIMLQKHIASFINNSNGEIKRKSGKPYKGISERLGGKEGHIRNRLMGKRVDNSARDVITADPNIRINEVGIPLEIAEILSFPEKITEFNIDEMTDLLNNGKVNTVQRGFQNVRVRYLLKTGKKFTLKIGDIVFRHLRDGDTAIFNRQPTLHRGSMMAHYVKILPAKTFRLNLSVTSPYNADFDGRP